ncbi:MAG: class I fructose-bisphosphate aldolase, partial [Sediminibacterium sp.]
MPNQQIIDLLGDKAGYLLDHTCTTIPKSSLHVPSPNHVDDIWIQSNRNNQTLISLQTLLNHG